MNKPTYQKESHSSRSAIRHIATTTIAYMTSLR